MNFKELPEFDKGWLVGIFDGEAYFGFDKCHKTATCQLEMTDKDTMDKVCSILGWGKATKRKTKRKPHWSDTYRWQVNGKRALLLMVDMFPYMSDRRQQRIQEVVLEYGR